jgi:mannosyltransferase OCH1-like enzyme
MKESPLGSLKFWSCVVRGLRTVIEETEREILLEERFRPKDKLAQDLRDHLDQLNQWLLFAESARESGIEARGRELGQYIRQIWKKEELDSKVVRET